MISFVDQLFFVLILKLSSIHDDFSRTTLTKPVDPSIVIEEADNVNISILEYIDQLNKYQKT
ncbi:hypothetical protein COV93_08670 [Candidatus Woesearchaeota archaeon CG11_big_fil_rev_8_21_14_0_20_43_8]|nr:MAG: hypothetical protein COV93_08670 [Candidatus Woesearchaeota archaeon CG11_big_fil_rev_8_21_14_0_20_43_8]PIO08918.1 MAG: hypothetical protein COT47_00685 [Candidatus Woesearchaeota archaeon CG08_land_8_20_14_0_20_43_7]